MGKKKDMGPPNGLGFAKIAHETGIARLIVSGIYRGIVEPNTGSLEKLARNRGITVSQLQTELSVFNKKRGR